MFPVVVPLALRLALLPESMSLSLCARSKRKGPPFQVRGKGARLRRPPALSLISIVGAPLYAPSWLDPSFFLYHLVSHSPRAKAGFKRLALGQQKDCKEA